MLIDAIKTELESWIDDRDPSKISMSSLGQCARALAYRHHKINGTAIDWRGRAILDDGDRGHAQIRSWIRRGLIKSGSCYALMAQEQTVQNAEMTGHIDGLLRHRPSCKNTGHGDELLEVKTVNRLGFERVTKGDIGQHYLDQSYGYLKALNLRTVRFIFKNKDTSELFETTRELDEPRLEQRLAVVALVKASAGPEEIGREHESKKGGYLPWQCNYCPFVRICWRSEGVHEVARFVYKIVPSDNKLPVVL